jgi:hypothetical protein
MKQAFSRKSLEGKVADWVKGTAEGLEEFAEGPVGTHLPWVFVTALITLALVPFFIIKARWNAWTRR